MTRTIKLPEFKVDCGLHSSPSVHWQDGERRFHIWITDAGELQSDILHSNPVDPPGIGQHRGLDATSKKWAPLVDAILAKIKADGLIAKARAAAKEKAEREAEDRQRAMNEKRLARLAAACAHFPLEIDNAIAALPEERRLAFVVSIDPRLD